MTRNKKLLIMLICLVCLIIVYFGVKAWSENSSQDDGDVYYMTDVNLDDIVQLDWTFEGEKYVIYKTDGIWTAPYNSDIVIDQEAAEAMAASVCNIEASIIIDDAADYKDYGFYDDMAGIKVETIDGSAFTILTGSYNEVALDYYAMIQGENNVYVVKGHYIDSFECTINDLAAEEETETET